MRIGLLQFDVIFGEKEYNLKNIETLLDRERADLWVLPELCTSGYLFASTAELKRMAENVPNGESTQHFIHLAKKYQTTIAAGIAEADGDKIFNSAIVVCPSGLVGVYRKVHLFDREKIFFEPGNIPFQVLDLGTAKIGVMICFDWIFPEAMRTLSMQGAEIICHPSNLVMPYCQNAMVTRCLENRVFAITANRIGIEKRSDFELIYTGGSQITSYDGEILYRGSDRKEIVAVLEIEPSLARNKHINQRNNLLNDLRPEMYLTKK